MRRRLQISLALTSLLLTVAVLSPAAALADGVEILDPGELVAGAQAKVQFLAGAENHRSLSAVWHHGTASCATNYYSELGGDGGSVSFAYGDTSIGPGGKTVDGTFTPPSAGDYTVCAYLEDYTTSDVIRTSRTVTARTPRGSVSLAVGGDSNEGGAAAITVSGTTEAERYLYVYANSGQGGCPAEKPGYTDDLTPVLPDTTYGAGKTVGPGSYDVSATYSPPAATAVTYCAYLMDSAYGLGGQHLAASDSKTVTSCCAPPAPALTTPNMTVPFGRSVFLEWSGGAATSQSVWIWAGPSAGKAEDAIAQLPVDADDDGAMPNSLDVSHALPPGSYSWIIVRTRGAWAPVASTIGTFTIVPARLHLLGLGIHKWGGRHVTASLRIKATPYSRLTVHILRNGKTFSRARWTQEPQPGDSSPRTRIITVHKSCAKPGRYTARVAAVGPGGEHMRRTRVWHVPSCSAIAAKEHRAALRRAAAERRAEQRYEAEQRREREAYARRFAAWENDCRRVGGTPRRFSNGLYYCVGAYGTIAVPGWDY